MKKEVTQHNKNSLKCMKTQDEISEKSVDLKESKNFKQILET